MLGSKIIYIEVFGQPIVVLNSVQAGTDLLDKRSSIYSSRLFIYLTRAIDLTLVLAPTWLCFWKCAQISQWILPWLTLHSMNINYFFSFLPYGDIWRRSRRLLTQYFSPKTLDRDKDRITDFVRGVLIAGLYQAPQDFRSHIRRYVVS